MITTIRVSVELLMLASEAIGHLGACDLAGSEVEFRCGGCVASHETERKIDELIRGHVRPPSGT